MKAVKKDVFDINKVTVVGSPTITSDGVASGFSNVNYFTIPKEIINSLIGHNWKIEYEFKTKPVANGTGHRYLLGTNYVNNTTNPINLGFFNMNYFWFANLLLSDGSRTANFYNVLNNTNFGSMKGYLEFTGSLYINAILQETDTSWKISQVSSELSIAEATEDLRIGYNLTSGSIDLTQFKIYVDGVLVYSPTKPTYLLERRKEGFDLSKFTVVGSPTITDDGVASGFSSNNYLKVPFTPSNNTWQIEYKFKLSSIASASDLLGGNSASSPSLALTVINARLTLSIGNGSAWQQSNIAGPTNLSVNTDYYLKIEYTGSKYNLYLSTDGENWILETTYTSSRAIGSSTLNLGVSRGGTGQLLGSIDLKQFSITVDGKEVFTGVKEKFYAIGDF